VRETRSVLKKRSRTLLLNIEIRESDQKSRLHEGGKRRRAFILMGYRPPLCGGIEVGTHQEGKSGSSQREGPGEACVIFGSKWRHSRVQEDTSVFRLTPNGRTTEQLCVMGEKGL